MAPDKVIELAPAVAVIAPEGQLPARPFGVETSRPDGRRSVNPIPVNELETFGFALVKLKVVVPPTGKLEAANDFVMVGGDTTVTDAVAGIPGPPLLEVTKTVFVLAPAVVPVTLIEIVQETAAAARGRLVALMANPPAGGFAGTVPFVKVTVVAPGVAVTVPPQVLLRAFGVDITSPEGRLSVSETPVSATWFVVGSS